MKTIFTLLLTLISAGAFAGDEIPKGTILVNPKVYKKKDFRRHKNIKVQSLKPAGVPHPQALPDKEQREAVFARVPGLEKYTGKMDELDRDLLYMRAKHGTEAEMREKTPDIPVEILRKLATEAKRP
jgi:hypothetical protein